MICYVSGAQRRICAKDIRGHKKQLPHYDDMLCLQEIESGGALHWPPNADEWQYYMEEARMTVCATTGNACCPAGNVGKAPFVYPEIIWISRFRMIHERRESARQKATTPPGLVCWDSHQRLSGSAHSSRNGVRPMAKCHGSDAYRYRRARGHHRIPALLDIFLRVARCGQYKRGTSHERSDARWNGDRGKWCGKPI
jgi:hypothetical protein